MLLTAIRAQFPSLMLMEKLKEDLQGIDLQLTECNQDLSNLEVRIDEVFVICCILVSLWKDGTLETSQKLQNLLFPDGIFWDKEIGGYRTEKENCALAVMRRITSICKKEKEEKSVEISSLTKCAPDRTRTYTSEDTRS